MLAYNTFVVSLASVYELSIKERLGKLNLNNGLDNSLDISRKKLLIKYLPLSEADYRNIVNIPKVLKKDGKPHGDPFDLLIISQALRRTLPVLTTDEYFPYYNDLWVKVKSEVWAVFSVDLEILVILTRVFFVSCT